jgi:ABC-type branched-subunit amino acid transport system substrate-binding protein
MALLAGCALLTACGSTVQQRSVIAGGPGTTGNGLGTLNSSGSTGSTLTETQAGTGTGGTGSPGSSGSIGTAGSTGGTGSTGSSGSVTPGQPGAASGPAVNVPGVTSSTIKIGVYTAGGYSSFAKSAGFDVALGDMGAEAKEVMDYINAHGGVLGRKLVPVIHDANIAAAASNPAAEYQAACAAWTQDHRVYAVVSPIGASNNTLYDCLAKYGVPTINSGESTDATFFQRYQNYFYEPTDLNLRRIMDNQVDALYSAGFFGKGAKIGMVLANNPYEKTAVEKGLKPALARHGLTLTDSFAVSTGSSNSSEYSSAVLRFRTAGITHVLFSFQASALLFMIAADNQGYTPRYGLHSRNSPAPVLQAEAPARQQRGAMGIGWQPMNDVDQAHDPGILNPRQKLCLDLVKKAGQDPSVRATALIGLWLCDDIFFLHDALERAAGFSMSALRSGAESLTDYEAASTFRSGFAPGHLHDGAKLFRLIAYKDDCSCYQYVSPSRTAK